MKTLVSRPIEGITINGDEFLCDQNGVALIFDSNKEAIEFLVDAGLSQEVAESMNFTEVEDDNVPVFSHISKNS